MKKISIEINYNTQWGEIINIIGSVPELGNWDYQRSVSLEYTSSSTWKLTFEVSKNIKSLDFMFLVIQNGEIIRQEDGATHSILLGDIETNIECIWSEESRQSYFQTSVFSNSIFHHKYEKQSRASEKEIQIIVTCLHVEQSQELVLLGNSTSLGRWEDKDSLVFQAQSYGKWHVKLNKSTLLENIEYKLAIRDKDSKKIIEWEDGDNRAFKYNKENIVDIIELQYRKAWINWKASGVAIPIFSLRSHNSYGIGEFTDLNLLVDWATNARLKVIQVLPINDTTATYTWTDSYPYNAISIYALHPIYLGLQKYQLKDKVKNEQYLKQAEKLNQLDAVDYSKIIKLKTEYIKELFLEIGQSTLKSKGYLLFYKNNKNWLTPYAQFCYMREKYNTTNISEWGEFETYNEETIAKYITQSKQAQETINIVYFTQYLLHTQLTAAKEYAYTKGVILKGDIPIGISPNSVEAWTEPHLFNLDTQTGAPPDDFSVNGQNWGFPTYNWEKMQKKDYQWWTKRFVKMADYFDAYRIDHILGFFRIWEIPNTSVQGLLGYFSPALPLSSQEVQSWDFVLDKEMTVACIHEDDLSSLFGEYEEEVKSVYLSTPHEGWYGLKKECNNQRKIQKLFHPKGAAKDLIIRDGLYSICNEVLFIIDKYDESKLHPRISLQHTLRYNRLDTISKDNLNKLYENYFFHRHSQFWRDEAMKKLPTLTNATNMLVCGEDLGMVPESVPSVMNDLQILSLEIQRMPKQLGAHFSNLEQLPYLSVATTSTHDMSPIRMWWKENDEVTQDFYTNILKLRGKAPKECGSEISLRIIKDHLASPAMLTILPLQDWLAISDSLKREIPEDERINIPSDPHHNWNYRMHLNLEELVKDKAFTERIRLLNEENGR